MVFLASPPLQNSKENRLSWAFNTRSGKIFANIALYQMETVRDRATVTKEH